MKALEVHQMEKIEGGNAGPAACGGLALATVATAAIIAASNPVGWFAIGASLAWGYGSGVVLGATCYV